MSRSDEILKKYGIANDGTTTQRRPSEGSSGGKSQQILDKYGIQSDGSRVQKAIDQLGTNQPQPKVTEPDRRKDTLTEAKDRLGGVLSSVKPITDTDIIRSDMDKFAGFDEGDKKLMETIASADFRHGWPYNRNNRDVKAHLDRISKKYGVNATEIMESYSRNRNREEAEAAKARGQETAEHTGKLVSGALAVGGNVMGGLTGALGHALEFLVPHDERFASADPNNPYSAGAQFSQGVHEKNITDIMAPVDVEAAQKNIDEVRQENSTYSPYLTGASQNQSSPYAAGQQAGIAKEPEIKDEEWKKRAAVNAYNAAVSVGESTLRLGLTLGNENASLGIAGMQAFQDAYADASERGASRGEAAGYAATVALTEVLTEKIPTKWMKKIATGGAKGKKMLLDAASKLIGSDAFGEEASYLIEFLADKYIMQDKSEWNLAVGDMIAGGATEEEAEEAQKQQFWQGVKDTFWTSLISSVGTTVGAKAFSYAMPQEQQEATQEAQAQPQTAEDIIQNTIEALQEDAAVEAQEATQAEQVAEAEQAAQEEAMQELAPEPVVEPVQPQTDPIEQAVMDLMPKQEQTNITPTIPASMGVERTVYNGTEPVNIRYAIVPMESLNISNDEAGNVNPAYPKELQPRDRTRPESRIETEKMSRGLIPEKLIDSYEVQTGSPIIRSDGVVVAGNGRAMAIRGAYQNYSDKSGKTYRDRIVELAPSLGIDVSAVPQNPVLVRIADDGADFSSLATKSNESNTGSYSSTETAMIDAGKMGDIISYLAPSEDGQLNTEFVQKFVSEVVPSSERNNVVDADFDLSQDGQRRIENAVLAYAYENEALVKRITESTDNNAKRITNAMMSVAPKIAKLKAAIKAGDVQDLGLTEAMVDAANLYLDAKQSSQHVLDAAAQMEMTDSGIEPRFDGLAVNIGNFLEKNAASGKKILDFYNILTNNNMEARTEQASEMSLFGSTEPMTQEDLYDRAAEEYREVYGDKGKLPGKADFADYRQFVEKPVEESGTGGRPENESVHDEVSGGLREAVPERGVIEEPQKAPEITMQDDSMDNIRQVISDIKGGITREEALEKAKYYESIREANMIGEETKEKFQARIKADGTRALYERIASGDRESLLEELIDISEGRMPHQEEIEEIERAKKEIWPYKGKEKINSGKSSSDENGIMGRPTSPESTVGAAELNFGGKYNYEDSLYEGNIQPERRTDVRPDEVPIVNHEGEQVSAFAKNAMGSKNLTNEDTDLIKTLISEGKLTFDTRHTREGMERAAERIEQKGLTTAVADVTRHAENGETSADIEDEAFLLFKIYAGDRSHSSQQTAASLLVSLQKMATTASRSLSEFNNLFRQLTPEGKMMAWIDKARRVGEKAKKKSKTQQDVTISDETQQDFFDVATAEDTAVTDAQEELDRNKGRDAKDSAKDAVDKVLGEEKKKPKKPKKPQSPEEVGSAISEQLVKTAAWDGTLPQKDNVERLSDAIMAFIKTKSEPSPHKKPNRNFLDALNEYYSQNEDFQTAWKEARDKTEDALHEAVQKAVDNYQEAVELDGDIEYAQEILQNAKEAFSRFTQFFDTGSMAQDAIDLLDKKSVTRKALNQALNGAGIKLSDLLMAEPDTVRAAKNQLATFIRGNYRNSKTEQQILSAFDAALDQEQAKRLVSMFEEKGKPDKPKQTTMEKFRELFNLGAFTRDAFIKEAALRKVFGYEGLDLSDELLSEYASAKDKTAVEKKILAEIESQTVNDIGIKAWNSQKPKEQKAAPSTDDLYHAIIEFIKSKKSKNPAKLVSRSRATEALKNFYADSDNFKKAWYAARRKAEADLANDPEGMKLFHDFLNENAKMLDAKDSRSVSRKAVTQLAKETDTKLNDLVAASLQDKQAALDKITAHMVENYGMDTDTAAAVSQQIQDAFFAEMAERQGKRLEAMFAPKKPAQQRSLAERFQELYNLGAFDENGKFSRQALQKLFGQDGLELSREVLDEYGKASEARQAVIMDRITSEIASQINTTAIDVIDEIRYFNMLANPSTHLRNLSGNLGQFIIQMGAKNSVKAGIEKLAGGKLGRTSSILNVASKKDQGLIVQAWNDFPGVAKEVENGGKYDQMKDAVNEKRRRLKLNSDSKAAQAINKGLGKVEGAMDLNTKALNVEDEIFGRMAYSAALAGYMKANKTDVITDEARAYAIQEAREATFHDESWLYTKLNKGERGFLSRVILPFLKTPANVTSRTVEYSPVSVLTGTVNMIKGAHQGNELAQKGLNQLSKGLTGSTLYAIGAWMVANGLLRVTGTGGEKEREYQRLMGERDWTLTANGEQIDVKFLAPGIVPILTGGAVFEAIMNHEKGNVAWKDVANTFYSMVDPIMESSMLSSFEGLVSAIRRMPDEGPEAGELLGTLASETMKNLANQFVPSFLRRLVSAEDNVQRRPYIDRNKPFDDIIQGMKGGLPGARKDQMPKLDVWGQPFVYDKTMQDIPGGMLARAVNPSRLYDTHKTPIDDIINGILKEGYDALPASRQPNTITMSGINADGSRKSEEVKLTQEQLETYEATEGQLSYQMAEGLANNDVFRSLPAELQSKALNIAYGYANEYGKNAAVPEYSPDYPGYLAGKDPDQLTDSIVTHVISDDVEAAYEMAVKATDTTTAVKRMDEAYSLYQALPEDYRAQAMEDVSKIRYLANAKEAGMATEDFVDLYRDYKTIYDQEGKASKKAVAWSNALDKAVKNGTITEAQANVMQDDLGYYSIIPANADRYDKYIGGGMDPDTALAIDSAVAELTGAKNHEKITAISRLDVPDSAKETAIRAAVPDNQEWRIDFMLDHGWTIGDYAAAYAGHSKNSNDKKSDDIADIMDSMGVDEKTAGWFYYLFKDTKLKPK